MTVATLVGIALSLSLAQAGHGHGAVQPAVREQGGKAVSELPA